MIFAGLGMSPIFDDQGRKNGQTSAVSMLIFSGNFRQALEKHIIFDGMTLKSISNIQ